MSEEKKVQITKADRIKVSIRSWLLQGSWNYERMQNGGWAFALIPVLKKLYPGKEEASAALKRHLEFFNTHPYVAAPILGVTMAMEEDRANGAPIDDKTIQGIKVGMMGPLAGIGDPVFWFTIRPIVGSIAASLAASGSLIGPLFFFIVWNIIRIAFLWYTQEFGYKAGSDISKDLSGGLLQKVTKIASILGMFIMGVLVPRWTTMNFILPVSSVKLQKGAYFDFSTISGNVDGSKLQHVLEQFIQNGKLTSLSVTNTKVTTLQDNLDQLVPGLAALLLTFLCMWLLKKKVSPIVIIFGLFGVGIIAHLIHLM